MTALRARVVPKWPLLVQGSGGVTVSESRGVATIGFDYANSVLGTELAQAVSTATDSATAAQTAAADAATAADTLTVGTTSGTVAAGDDSRFYVKKSGSGSANVKLNDLYKSLFTPQMYGAKSDLIIFKEAITVSGTTLTVTNARFTSADVGKIISIGGAGYYMSDALLAGVGVSAAGTGYPASSLQTVTIAGGTSIEAATVIVNVDSGGTCAFNQISASGKYSVPPNNPAATTGGGGGTGLTINMGWRALPHTTTIAAFVSSTQVTLAAAAPVAVSAATQTVYYGTDDTSAVINCFADAVAAHDTGSAVEVGFTGGTIINQQISATLAPNGQSFAVAGLSLGARIAFANTNSSQWGLVLSGNGPISSIVQFTADSSIGATQIQSTGAPFVDGDILRVYSEPGLGPTGARGQLTSVANVSAGSVFHIDYPLAFEVDHNQPSELQSVACARYVTVSDLTIDGFGNTGEGAQGLVLFYMDKPTVRNVAVRHWWTDQSVGFGGFCLLDPEFDVHADLCGGGTGADAMSVQYVAAGHMRLKQRKTWGFGIGIDYTAGSELDLMSYDSVGRSIKLFGACGNKGNAHAYYSRTGFVGFALSNGSENNDFHNVTAIGHNIGVWANGTGNNNNQIASLRVAGNTTDISVSSGDSNFRARMAPGSDSPVIADTGTNTRIETSDGARLTKSGSIGFGTGSGGAITQITSKTTSVTLDAPTGQITTHNAALAAGAAATFIVFNSKVTSTDLVFVCQMSGGTAGAYVVQCTNVGSGSFQVTIRNITAGSLSESLTFAFAVIKGAAS